MYAFASAAYILIYFRLDFFMEANNMNPDQTKQSDLGPYCLQYRLPNKHEPTRGADDKIAFIMA